MDRWALKQAVAMLEAKAEQGHLSPEEERRIRERLAEGDATSALEALARQVEVAERSGYAD